MQGHIVSMSIFFSVLLLTFLCVFVIDAQGVPLTVRVKNNGEELAWKGAYANHRNGEYIDLINKVRPKLTLLFQDLASHIITVITGFRSSMGVLCDFNVTIANISSLSAANFTAVLDSRNATIDIKPGSLKTYKGVLMIASEAWGPNHSNESSSEYRSLERNTKEALETIYQNTPGFVRAEVIVMRRSYDGKADVEFHLHVESPSKYKLQDLKNILQNAKGHGSLVFGTFTMTELDNASGEDKETWVLALVIMGCTLVAVLTLLFLCCIVRQSCFKPKLMPNKSGGSEARENDGSPMGGVVSELAGATVNLAFAEEAGNGKDDKKKAKGQPK